MINIYKIQCSLARKTREHAIEAKNLVSRNCCVFFVPISSRLACICVVCVCVYVQQERVCTMKRIEYICLFLACGVCMVIACPCLPHGGVRFARGEREFTKQIPLEQCTVANLLNRCFYILCLNFIKYSFMKNLSNKVKTSTNKAK